ncbi:MAG TPA: GntR family transcriptional regulator [Bryobacteraceae bacterium]|nr:GntR family transcriptional regulator [Bryobacteraceae bacterium]
MGSKVQLRTAMPVREQLRSILAAEIARGRYASGAKLPSERELAVVYGTSRTSVRQALDELVQEGVLFRAVGKGTFVAESTGAGTANESPPEDAGKRTLTLAFVIGENILRFVQAGYHRILLGARKACQENGCRLLFHSVSEDEPETEQGIDGCIVAGGAPHRMLERLRAAGTPLVLADLLLLDESASSIGFDYAGGMRQAMTYLHDLGHRKIGFVGFPNSEKYVAYWQSLAAFGLVYDPHIVEFLQLPDLQPSILSGYRTMQKLLGTGRLPTAIVATNDLVAYGMMEALAVADIPVPDHISVLGFDDLGQDAYPPLTTIRTDSAEVGRLAVRCLLDQIREGVVNHGRIAVPTELVIRTSTAPPDAREDTTKT